MSLSIVIPVYNAEATIQRAILSADALGDVEIICVDDGSQDSSVQRIGELCLQRASIVLLQHEKNRGVGAARNSGIAHASRKWITFLDADDKINDGISLPLILKKLEDFNPDLMFCLHHVDGHNKYTFDYGLPPGTMTRQALVSLANAYLNSPHGNSIVSHCWGKIYRLEFLLDNRLFFREDLPIYEDTEFVARCFGAAYNAFFSQEILYQHMSNRNLSNFYAILPLGFRFALDQFALMADSTSLIAKANAIFLAKTLSLSRKLSLVGRIKLCQKLWAEANSLEIEPSGIQDPLLRMIVDRKWYRYALPCSLLISLTA